MAFFDQKYLSGKNQRMILDRIHALVLAKNEKKFFDPPTDPWRGVGEFRKNFFSDKRPTVIHPYRTLDADHNLALEIENQV